MCKLLYIDLKGVAGSDGISEIDAAGHLANHLIGSTMRR